MKTQLKSSTILNILLLRPNNISRTRRATTGHKLCSKPFPFPYIVHYIVCPPFFSSVQILNCSHYGPLQNTDNSCWFLLSRRCNLSLLDFKPYRIWTAPILRMCELSRVRHLGTLSYSNPVWTKNTTYSIWTNLFRLLLWEKITIKDYNF